MAQGFAATQAPEFLPPPEPGILRSAGIAVLAHVVLALALSWGIRWNQSDTKLAVEAEIWAPTVQQAAPKPVEPLPQPAPEPKPEPRPEPKPEPAPPPPQGPTQADIAVEREKQRRAQEQAKQAEERRQAELRKRQEAERQAAEAQRKREEQARAAAEAKRRQEQQQRQQQQEEQRLAQMREENLRRIQGMAGATGGPTAQGTAQRAAGPSDSYAGRVRARVKPNIVFTDDVPGNPSAEVRVRLSPDGTIVDIKLLKSSGVKSWDDAVQRALQRTEVLPRDVDGRVPGTMDLVFRPRD